MYTHKNKGLMGRKEKEESTKEKKEDGEGVFEYRGKRNRTTSQVDRRTTDKMHIEQTDRHRDRQTSVKAKETIFTKQIFRQAQRIKIEGHTAQCQAKSSVF